MFQWKVMYSLYKWMNYNLVFDHRERNQIKKWIWKYSDYQTNKYELLLLILWIDQEINEYVQQITSQLSVFHPFNCLYIYNTSIMSLELMNIHIRYKSSLFTPSWSFPIPIIFYSFIQQREKRIFISIQWWQYIHIFNQESNSNDEQYFYSSWLLYNQMSCRFIIIPNMWRIHQISRTNPIFFYCWMCVLVSL